MPTDTPPTTLCVHAGDEPVQIEVIDLGTGTDLYRTHCPRCGVLSAMWGNVDDRPVVSSYMTTWAAWAAGVDLDSPH